MLWMEAKINMTVSQEIKPDWIKSFFWLKTIYFTGFDSDEFV